MIDYASYVRDLRRQIHKYPEIGFDLPKTLALVKGELEKWGIPYTEKYGKSSVVATINEEKAGFTIGIRADMDALPIQEEHSYEYASQHPGIMHACGHDAHTAILIATARRLQEMKDQINCRVKLLFTPAEEYIEPGCKGMAEDGVMDDIDIIVALHVDKDFPAGTIAINEGGQGGNSMGFTVDFYGTASHAAQQHRGKDAIAMAMEAYMAMEMMAMKEVNPVEPRLLNIGSIHGGNTNNILCNHCSMFGSSRTHSDEVSQYMIDRIKEICEGIAACNGGRAEVKVVKFLPYVINDPAVCALVRKTAEKVVGPEHISARPKRTLGGEDFAFLCRRKPGMMFRLGSHGENPDTRAAGHSVRFDIDEKCLMVGVEMFTQFVLDNMNGL